MIPDTNRAGVGVFFSSFEAYTPKADGMRCESKICFQVRYPTTCGASKVAETPK
jgi:hypothetical protein